MSETEKNEQAIGQSTTLVSKSARTSVRFAIFGWACFAAGIPLMYALNHLDNDKLQRWIMPALVILIIAWLFLNFLAFITALVGLWEIRKHKGRLTGTGKSLSGIAISLLVIVPIFLFVIYVNHIIGLMECANNMSVLRNGIFLYAEKFNEKYPEPNKWCDLLIEFEDLNKKQFRCKCYNCKNDQLWSSFAINPYCNIRCPNGIVLLFETKAGWNQHGGPELLTLNNHNGKGTNILFNDGTVRYIRKGEIGKLKWKAEANEANQPASH
jgi:hypothetical protein